MYIYLTCFQVAACKSGIPLSHPRLWFSLENLPLTFEMLSFCSAFWELASSQHFSQKTSDLTQRTTFPATYPSAVHVEIEVVPPLHPIGFLQSVDHPNGTTQAAAYGIGKPIVSSCSMTNIHIFFFPWQESIPRHALRHDTVGTKSSRNLFCLCCKKEIPKWAIVSVKQVLISMALVWTFLFQKIIFSW